VEEDIDGMVERGEVVEHSELEDGNASGTDENDEGGEQLARNDGVIKDIKEEKEEHEDDRVKVDRCF
jgi:hypothetical protein